MSPLTPAAPPPRPTTPSSLLAVQTRVLRVHTDALTATPVSRACDTAECGLAQHCPARSSPQVWLRSNGPGKGCGWERPKGSPSLRNAQRHPQRSGRGCAPTLLSVPFPGEEGDTGQRGHSTSAVPPANASRRHVAPPPAPPECLFKPTHCSANWITFRVKIDLLRQQQRRQIKTAVAADARRGGGPGGGAPGAHTWASGLVRVKREGPVAPQRNPRGSWGPPGQRGRPRHLGSPGSPARGNAAACGWEGDSESRGGC